MSVCVCVAGYLLCSHAQTDGKRDGWDKRKSEKEFALQQIKAPKTARTSDELDRVKVKSLPFIKPDFYLILRIYFWHTFNLLCCLCGHCDFFISLGIGAMRKSFQAKLDSAIAVLWRNLCEAQNGIFSACVCMCFLLTGDGGNKQWCR